MKRLAETALTYSPTRQQRTKNLQATRKLSHLVVVSNKPILPDGYRQDLVKPIVPIEGMEIEPKTLLTRAIPKVVWLNPRKHHIYIDHNIQREFEASDLRVLKEIAENFDWGQFKVPNLVEVPEWGKVFCTDGQKATYAALYQNISIPFLKTIESPETYIKRQAVGFVGINHNRTAIKSSQLFSALYYRGDQNEISLSGILTRYGIKPKAGGGGRIKKTATPLETTCINILRKMHAEHNKKTFDIICRILAGVKFRPIRRAHLGALNIIPYRMEIEKIDVDRMINGILSISDEHALLKASENARKINNRSGMISVELANIYMVNYKKPVSYTQVKPY